MVETRRSRFRGRDQKSKTPLRVLVVEDSPDDTILLSCALRRGGYEPFYERVETPEAMRDALDRERWDVVISDHEMPRFSAPAALGILQEGGLDLPFIIVSGQIGEEAAANVMRAGAHDYIVKGNLARLCPAIGRELREAAERRERRRSEAAFRQSEELYRTVVEQSSECIFLVDARSKRLIEANDAFRELLGYAPEELREMTLYDFVAHDRASVDENTRLIAQEGRQDIGERRYRRKDGTLVHVEVQADTLLLGGREVICYVSRDVTERKLAERRRDVQYAVSRILAESTSLEEATPKLLETIGAGLGWELGLLWMVNQRAGVLRCKEVWHAPSVVAAEFEATSREMSYVPGHGLPGRVWESGEPLWIPDVLKETNFPRHKSAAREGLHAFFAFPIQDRGRILGIIEFFSHRILPPDMDLLQTVAILGNQIGQFIERKWVEEQLSEIKESERRRIAADLHDDVLQDMVYGLREIQTARNAAARGDDSPNTAVLERIAKALRRSVEGLREAIFELRLEENLERSFISSIESLVGLNRRMSHNRFEVQLNFEDGFPVSFPARTGRELTRIVQEALHNSRRHSDAKNIRVSLRMDGDAFICVEVADDGRGFDTTGARYGVGLSVMGQRALDLGGQLEIESEPGAGTIVRFRAPADRLLEAQSNAAEGDNS